jgi:hypothetical protein
LHRPLSFHLGQAPLSCRCFEKIARVLRDISSPRELTRLHRTPMYHD